MITSFSVHPPNLPHHNISFLPGMKVAESRKRKWDGNLADIDEDFVRFVDELCNQVFGEIRTQKVLGQDLAPQSFAKVVETLATAFSGMEVSQMSMVRRIKIYCRDSLKIKN
jgi:hypothetical protein